MKYKYYVAILFQGGVYRFVTGKNNITRTAMWESGKPAVNFSLSVAKDLVFGLVCNGYPAVVVTAPESFELSNPAEVDA